MNYLVGSLITFILAFTGFATWMNRVDAATRSGMVSPMKVEQILEISSAVSTRVELIAVCDAGYRVWIANKSGYAASVTVEPARDVCPIDVNVQP